MKPLARFASLSALLLAAACSGPASGGPSASVSTTPAETASKAADAAAQTPSAAASESAPKPSRYALEATGFRQLMDGISEPDANFFSDNFISNETSYLQPAAALSQRPQGGAYIGVGPEQNFTYIALTRPDRAYILDIRRDNLVLHLLYKAAFDAASSRAHLLALLTGRPFDAAQDVPASATAEQVIAAAEKKPATAESFKAAHEVIKQQLTDYGVKLSAKDTKSLLRAHTAFFKDGFDLRFKLKANSFRRYPTLRSLLSHKTPQGEQAGFIASEASFRYLQKMQREHRIVPVVGDFAGDHALAKLAEQLKKDDMVVRSFYVSNVEQYLMQNGVWWKWQRNIAALPTDASSIFIRGYLDQGKAHPQQMPGHRTATTLHLMDAFKQRKQPFASMWALATAGVLKSEASRVKLADAGSGR